MKNLFQISVFSVLLSIAITSCDRTPSYSEVPRIEFDSINKYRIQGGLGGTSKTDSIVVTVYFEDGDGDLGNFKQDSTQNYFIDIFRKKGGVFSELDFLDLGRTFPMLAPNEEYLGPLEGTLSLNTQLLHGIDINNGLGTPDPDLIDYGDTIRFEVKIQDRTGHMSNLITTDELIITP